MTLLFSVFKLPNTMDSVRWAFNFCNWKPKQQDWAVALSLIQSEERDRIKRFVFKKDAKASLIGRLMLRKYAALKLNLPWSSIHYSRTEKGRPYLTNSLPELFKDADVNVSHQGEWVVLAAELGPKIGVDVMKVEPAVNKDVAEFFRLMRRQFTTDEWLAIKKSSDDDDQLSCFYRNWCLKEAVVKAIGTGIGYELQRISFNIPTVNLTTSNITTDTTVFIDEKLDNKWSFEETKLDSSHPVAVALLWGDLQAPLQEQYSIKDRPNFDILSFDDFIIDSEELAPVDLATAAEMLAKDETPSSK